VRTGRRGLGVVLSGSGGVEAIGECHALAMLKLNNISAANIMNIFIFLQFF
jgi:hypothetical protein